MVAIVEWQLWDCHMLWKSSQVSLCTSLVSVQAEGCEIVQNRGTVSHNKVQNLSFHHHFRTFLRTFFWENHVSGGPGFAALPNSSGSQTILQFQAGGRGQLRMGQCWAPKPCDGFICIDSMTIILIRRRLDVMDWHYKLEIL